MPRIRIALVALSTVILVSLMTSGVFAARSRHHHNHRGHHRGARLDTLQPRARTNFTAAVFEMKRSGLRPSVNSTFRSTAEQRSIFHCAHRASCRRRRGIYGARRPGTSLHEAGLAVDLGGVASGRKHHRRLTRRGQQMVKIMRRHGFEWRYGLKDPAHFEISAHRAGFRTERAAIQSGQAMHHAPSHRRV
jgi:LAS superfamily LD-carboxypeptidase LdcB